ncbi:hypothetical protein BMW23_0309 [Bodo saltans virus]|uniref:Uncharacterized protein n=1 Tax=Bodo saltans virus TaxID=2024608 RepID=A0A2H4UU34_9VIRU|nr:hypothetical protein QJ851_gp0304 [Bodo saltans virus]ATZ80367.1 hypothetical protein BMW23_0309 [Bodo saltans virus]
MSDNDNFVMITTIVIIVMIFDYSIIDKHTPLLKIDNDNELNDNDSNDSDKSEKNYRIKNKELKKIVDEYDETKAQKELDGEIEDEQYNDDDDEMY